ADRIDAEARHQPEVFADAARGGTLVPLGIGRKRAVGDAFDEKPLIAGAQEFAVRRHALGRGPDLIVRGESVSLNGSIHSREWSSSRRNLLLYQSFGESQLKGGKACVLCDLCVRRDVR